MAASMGRASSARVRELLADIVRPPRDHASQSESCGVDVCEDANSKGPLQAAVLSKPLDMNLFWERVSTYKTFTWFGKPESLSPLECARHGWENVAHDTLQCVSCRAFVTGRMPVAKQPEIYQKCVEKLVRSLKSGHHISCPWTNNPSPDAFRSIIPVKREECVQHFRQRFAQLCSFNEGLPNLGPHIERDVGWTETDVQSVIEGCVSDASHADSEVQLTSAALVLTGWKCSEKQSQMLQCDICLREVGLWNFVSLGQVPSEEEEEEEEEEEPSQKRIRTESLETPDDSNLCATESSQMLTESMTDDLAGSDSAEAEVSTANTDLTDADPSKDSSDKARDCPQELPGAGDSNCEAESDIKGPVLTHDEKGAGDADFATPMVEEPVSDKETLFEKDSDKEVVGKDLLNVAESGMDVAEAVEATETVRMEESPVECVTAVEATDDPDIQAGNTTSAEASNENKQQSEDDVPKSAASSPELSTAEVEQAVEATEDATEIATEVTEDIPDNLVASLDSQTSTPSTPQLPTENQDSRLKELNSDVAMQQDSNETVLASNENATAGATADESALEERSNDTSPATTDPSDSEQHPPTQAVKKRLRKRRRGFFHPLQEHQRWCPWVRSSSCGYDVVPKPDWKRLYDILVQRTPKKKTSLQNPSSPAETILFIRNLFNDWTSP